MNEIDDRVTLEKDSKQLRKLRDCQSVLAEIADFAFNYPVSSTLRDRLRVFWNCNFDYGLFSEAVGESYETARVSMSRVSRGLYQVMGSNWYFFIMSVKPLDAYIDFIVRTGKGGGLNVFPSEYTDMFPTDNGGKVFKIEDCTEELNFLRSITTISIKKQLEELDQDKLAFLMKILKGRQQGYGDMQKKLWFYVYGKKEFKDLINVIREHREE